MKIRNATPLDYMEIVGMARKFYATTFYKENVAAMSSDAARNCALLGTKTGTMLVVEDHNGKLVGMACLIVVPFMFNPVKKSADEVVWWVDPEAQSQGIGRALLEAIEPACRAAGVDIIRMMLLASSPPQAAKLYESLGYAHTESTFTKVL